MNETLFVRILAFGPTSYLLTNLIFSPSVDANGLPLTNACVRAHVYALTYILI